MPNRLATLVAVALGIAACSAPSPQPDGTLDGIYSGTQTQDPACGTEVRAVTFDVSGGRIAINSRRRTRQFDGTVSADGRITLQNGFEAARIEGAIRDGTLTASEAAAPGGGAKHRRSALDDPTALTCVWRFVAARASPEGR